MNKNQDKAKFDTVNKGADMMIEGSDMMMKKDKQMIVITSYSIHYTKLYDSSWNP